MKKVIVMCLSVALLALTDIAKAEEATPNSVSSEVTADGTTADETADSQTLDAAVTPGPWRLKPNAKWHLLGHGLAMPAWLMLTYTLHEGSHSLAAIAAGGQITSFKPYPHFETIEGKKSFYMGSFTAEFKKPISNARMSLLLAAPYLTEFALFAASDLTLTYGLNKDSAAAPFFLFGGMLAPFIDFVANVNNPSVGNDWTRISKMSGIPRWSIYLVGDAIAAVAVWRLYVQARDVLFTNAPKTPPKTSVMILPLGGPNFVGLGLAGNF